MISAGIKAFVGKLSMDKSSRPTYVEDSADAALKAASSFIDKCLSLQSAVEPHERLVAPVLTPRFVPTCSDDLLVGLGKLAKERGLRIQSHMAESLDQVNWVRDERGVEDIDVFQRVSLFPQPPVYITRPQTKLTRLQSGLLTSRTIQAHCTFLAPDALARVASQGSSVAHCPLSNAYFSAEPFRLREALDRDVKVGLGTDIAGGYDIGIMSSMRHAVTTSRVREGARVMRRPTEGEHEASVTSLSIDWTESLYLATVGGAQALGLGEGAGRFVVGAPFDAQYSECIHERLLMYIF